MKVLNVVLEYDRKEERVMVRGVFSSRNTGVKLMTETKLSNSCKILSEHGILALEYTEHSPDPWYSSTETCIEIEKEKAIELVRTIVQHFKGHRLTDDEADAIARLL